MTRTLTQATTALLGETVTVQGWVHRIRDHKKVLFIDLRDRSGVLQIVTGPWSAESYAVLQAVGTEAVVSVTGTVAARPESLINPDLATGTVELQATSAEVLAPSKTPPFALTDDTREIEEEIRLKYRYLDQRSERMQRNMRARAAVMQLLRSELDTQGFLEVETPLLGASTPEGARDFVVPTRNKGTYYALPQSPQQYKQLLMAGGVERYYQFAKCLRDEDSRGDRQPEFTQLDMELSFATQEEVIQLNEALLIKTVEQLYPEKKIQTVPFPRLTYAEAMSAYGTDCPDLREDPSNPNILAFCWVLDFPFFEQTDDGSGWTFTHNPFSQPKAEHAEWHARGERVGEILTTQYDVVCNGYEIGGGSLRNHSGESLTQTFRIMGYADDRIATNFGHMIQAMEYGTPPHGGIAWGFDRLMMVLQNEPNIREVIAFPKNGEGRDPLMSAPGFISEAQSSELGLPVTRHGSAAQ
jgi:aspartyl-tRNA synthetase